VLTPLVRDPNVVDENSETFEQPFTPGLPQKYKILIIACIMISFENLIEGKKDFI